MRGWRGFCNYMEEINQFTDMRINGPDSLHGSWPFFYLPKPHFLFSLAQTPPFLSSHRFHREKIQKANRERGRERECVY